MIPKEDIERINAVPLSRLFPGAINKGDKFYCRCPECGAEGKKKSKMQGLQIVYDARTNKNFAKCFQCNFSLNGAIKAYGYLKNLDSASDFIKIIRELADQEGITLSDVEDKRNNGNNGNPIPGSFAYKQLKESGLTVKDITAEVWEGDRLIKVPVFQKGSLNVSTGGIDYFADEMLIIYYDLEGRRKKFVPIGGNSKKERPYTRVRWSNPDLHPDKKDNKPMKYQTPVGASAEIYIPQFIRDAYKSERKFETLFVQEGEKKAEKACKHGIPSVAIQGIYNFGNKVSGVPQEIQYLIQKCGIKNIVLLFDSDWQSLSKNLEQDSDVEIRPKTFAKAAIKFKRFVKTLHQAQIHVDIWFGHINENNSGAKGIDDLLCSVLNDREDELTKDIEKAFTSVSGIADYVSLHNISTSSEYQILDYWKLNSKVEFFEIHHEELINLKSFRFDKVLYNVVDNEIKQASEYGSGKEFWSVEFEEKEDKTVKKIKMSIIETKAFLEANGYRSYVDEENNNTFVRVDKGVISKIKIPDIHRYIYNYVDKASRDKDVLEYFAENMEKKLSHGKLNLLDPLFTIAGKPDKYIQWFYFLNSQIAIDESGINVEALRGPVWDDNLIKRDFQRVRIFEDIRKNDDGSFSYQLTQDGKECEFLKFLINVSHFPDFEEGGADYDTLHLINKLTCIGYLLRSHKRFVESKVVVGMDARMSEVGESNGRSGKSLIGLALKQMVNQAYASGRQMDDNEKFLLNDVRKTTDNIFIDDVKINFNIADLYSDITGDMTVNVKQGKRFSIPFEESPKFYITTNHAIRSEGDSTEDRTIFMAFSTYYSARFTPVMEFGHQFFSDWDDRQWTLFDNLMIECVFYYMQSIKFGWTKAECGAVPPPMKEINRRRERQNMGEAFFQWAESYFDPSGSNINSRIYRKELFEKFHSDVKGQQKFVTTTGFKKKILAYCQYKGYHFNPHKKHKESGNSFEDWRINNPGKSFIGSEEKTDGMEFFTVADDNFNNINSLLTY